MEKLLNLVISGVVSGAIYSVMASGLVLTNRHIAEPWRLLTNSSRATAARSCLNPAAIPKNGSDGSSDRRSLGRRQPAAVGLLRVPVEHSRGGAALLQGCRQQRSQAGQGIY